LSTKVVCKETKGQKKVRLISDRRERDTHTETDSNPKTLVERGRRRLGQTNNIPTIW
jgi:hypothetical protein